MSGNAAQSGQIIPPKTKKEISSLAMEARIEKYIISYYQGYIHKSPRDLNFLVEDGDLQLWECTMLSNDTGNSNELTIFFFWDSEELNSYDNYGSAFSEFVVAQKNLRLESKFKYYTSPLTVSATLALIMLIFIILLLFCNYDVPPQLWSVFTAVIAFYFGKEGGNNKQFEK